MELQGLTQYLKLIVMIINSQDDRSSIKLNLSPLTHSSIQRRLIEIAPCTCDLDLIRTKMDLKTQVGEHPGNDIEPRIILVAGDHSFTHQQHSKKLLGYRYHSFIFNLGSCCSGLYQEYKEIWIEGKFVNPFVNL
jgi:hypothetical protein